MHNEIKYNKIHPYRLFRLKRLVRGSLNINHKLKTGKLGAKLQ